MSLKYLWVCLYLKNLLIKDCYCYHPQADYELFKSLAGDEEGKCLEYIEWTLGKIHSVSNLQPNSQPFNNQATLEMVESRRCVCYGEAGV